MSLSPTTRILTHPTADVQQSCNPSSRVRELSLPQRAPPASGEIRHAGLVFDPVDLPVFQVDGRPPAQELDDRDELVTLAATNDGPLDPAERPRLDPHPRPHGHDRLGDDREA